jgi:hypothetical protein
MSLLDMAREALRQPPDPIVTEKHAAAQAPRVSREDWIDSLDLGQQADYSALAILRREAVTCGGHRRRYYDCPCLHRWALKAPYDRIVDDVARLFEEPHLHKQALVADTTGVGRGVLDLFRRQKVKAKIVPITVTAGNAVNPDDAGGWHVAKRELVSAVHVVIGSTRFNSEERLLKVNDKLELAAVLQKELETFTCKINIATSNPSWEAWREKDNDDLVLAVAQGAWYGENAMYRFTMA